MALPKKYERVSGHVYDMALAILEPQTFYHDN